MLHQYLCIIIERTGNLSQLSLPLSLSLSLSLSPSLAGHLYIVMELVEGAPLIEHINSLQEKGQRFTEARIWSIFTQLVLALRYMHKEKHIVHRDLSPSNLMLGEGDHLTITDFGLAKQKQREFSVMMSVVGTMPYWW